MAKPGSSSANIRSLRVSGASSAVSRRYLSGNEVWRRCATSCRIGSGKRLWCRASRICRTAPDPKRDLVQPVAGQIGEQVMLDLVAQVAAQESQRRPGVEVGASEHLAQIPLALVSPIISVLVNFSAPSGKCPQKITALAQMLRISWPPRWPSASICRSPPATAR